MQPIFSTARINTQAHEGLLTSAFGEQVKQRYLVFARAVDAYNTHLYTEWEQRVGAVATEKLKQPILCALAASRGQSSFENVVDGAGTKEPLGHTFLNPAKNRGPMHQQSTTSTDGSGMPPPPYGVNFATELHMIIRESKYLDRMGFQVGAGVCLLQGQAFSLLFCLHLCDGDTPIAYTPPAQILTGNPCA